MSQSVLNYVCIFKGDNKMKLPVPKLLGLRPCPKTLHSGTRTHQPNRDHPRLGFQSDEKLKSTFLKIPPKKPFLVR